MCIKKRWLRLRKGSSIGLPLQFSRCFRRFSQKWKSSASKFNTDRLYGSAVVRQCESYFTDRTADSMTSPLEKTDENYIASKNALFSSGTPAGRHKIQISAEALKRFYIRNGLILVSGGECNALELRYRVKSRDFKHSVFCDKRKLIITRVS